MISVPLALPLTSMIGVGLSLSMGGCVQPPKEVANRPDVFFAPYHAAIKTAGLRPVPATLVHLGLPTARTLVVWYYAPEKPAPLKVYIDDREWTDFSHDANSLHRTGRIEIRGLQPNTTYRVRLEGAVVTDKPLAATTAATDGQHRFSFLFGSCFEPYLDSDKTGTAVTAQTRASISNFARRATAEGGPAFFLGLGDQIYVDAGAAKKSPIAYLSGFKSRIMQGKLEEAPTYLNEITRLHLGLEGMHAAFSVLPSALMWDDHDIRDGWGSQGDEHLPEWQRYYQHARNAFVAFQAARNPNFSAIVGADGWGKQRPMPQEGAARLREGGLDFTFDWGAASFFVTDYRSFRTPDQGLTEHQRAEIDRWLRAKNTEEPAVFVFCFPVPVAANIGKPFVLAQWFGNDDAHDRILPADRRWLLERFRTHFEANPAHRLVILAGDVHYSGLQAIRLGGPQGRVIGHEVISSGMAQTVFNRAGGYWGAKSGYVWLGSEKLRDIWIQDHGMYSGPAFAELFVAPSGRSGPPELRLAFFPATLPDRQSGRRVNLALGADDLASAALEIEAYPKNAGDGANTESRLEATLQDFWLRPGRSEVVPD